MAKLIVLEGLDGSGKGTQTELLDSSLRQKGYRTRIIDFPDYASEGSVLVKMYLDGKLGGKPSDTNAYAASMFFAADRYVSYVRDWKEDYISDDTVIIANRYTTANAYHQLSKMPAEKWDSFLDWLWDFEFGKLGLPSPDLVLLLDMPEKVSNALVKSRSDSTGRTMDIHEKDTSYLSACRKAAGYVAERCGWVKISCAADDADTPYPREKIAEEVLEAALKIL